MENCATMRSRSTVSSFQLPPEPPAEGRSQSALGSGHHLSPHLLLSIITKRLWNQVPPGKQRESVTNIQPPTDLGEFPARSAAKL